MGESTHIEYADSSCNLTMGCKGCELWRKGARHCYAGKITYHHAGDRGWPQSFDKPAVFPYKLDQALGWKDLTGVDRSRKPWLNGLPRIVFLCDMGDPFTTGLDPLAWLAPRLPEIAASPHQWLLLTKYTAKMVAFTRAYPLPPNVWPGASITSHERRGRADMLERVEGGGPRWISYGSAIGPFDPSPWLGKGRVEWVVFEGESGRRARPTNLDWARATRDACGEVGVAFFMKQVGERAVGGKSKGGRREDIPADLWIRDMPMKAPEQLQLFAA